MNVLIVVDLQEGPFSLPGKYDADGVVVRINTLAEFIRRQGGRVIYIQHDGEAEENLLPGTPGWHILTDLNMDDSDLIVRKSQNDGFAGTELESTLYDLGAVNILIVGWATDFCVDSTVRSAVSRGFNVYIPSDGHTVANRPHLQAVKVIEHHNWIWENLIAGSSSIVVMPTDALVQHPNLNNALHRTNR